MALRLGGWVGVWVGRQKTFFKIVIGVIEVNENDQANISARQVMEK